MIGEATATIDTDLGAGQYRVTLAGPGSLAALTASHGAPPLPPYIKRNPAEADLSRYQTVYAAREGAVAAPTAGLHFTEAMLAHAGHRRGDPTRRNWTFLPVRVDTVEEHVMHAEYYDVSPESAERINEAKRQGRPIVAVGTTSWPNTRSGHPRR